MCNLNILLSKKANKNKTPFIMAVTSNSFASNPDGEGFYEDYSNTIYRSLIKINYLNFRKNLNLSQNIITHQRMATSGEGINYTHPFSNEDFILVHNGIINDFLKDEGSDTSGFFIEFNKKFKELTKGTREQRITQTIQALLNDMWTGSYSIALWDIKTRVIYYFKNYTTNMHIYKNKDYLYMTTNTTNDKFLPMLSLKEFEEIKIEDETIYKIENFKFKKIGEITKTNYTQYSTYTPRTKTRTIETTINHDWKNYKKSKKQIKKDNKERDKKSIEELDAEIEKAREDRKIEIGQHTEKCIYCGNKTRFFDYMSFSPVCRPCSSFYKIETMTQNELKVAYGM